MRGAQISTTSSIYCKTPDLESSYDEGIGNFGVFLTGKDALQAPNDEILGQKTPLSWPAANGRPPISSNSPDEFDENLPPLPPLTMQICSIYQHKQQ
jgi:hypothetical protein